MKTLYLLLLCSLMNVIKAQHQKISVMFYHSENFFIANDNSKKLGKTEALTTKQDCPDEIKHTATVIDTMGTNIELPALVGIYEEGKDNINQKINSHYNLNQVDYAILNGEITNTKGCKARLLYDRNMFILIESQIIKTSSGNSKTVDILFATLILNSKEKVYVFVTEFSNEKAEDKTRIDLAPFQKKINELLQKDSHAKIIIMGSVNGSLIAGNENKWRAIDQIVLSNGITHNNKGLHLDGQSAFFEEEKLSSLNALAKVDTEGKSYSEKNNLSATLITLRLK